ncbi:MAG: lipoprotein-releasing ABC transporter permease subunit [Alphaproteobacteria bacterium]
MFSAAERWVAWRYLRAKRQESFISIITGFSFLGIMLGVATLIIVMSVMNGFRQELLGRILGLNGHLGVYSNTGMMVDYTALQKKIASVKGVVSSNPLVERQVMATAGPMARGVLVHGMTYEDLSARKLIATNLKSGNLEAFQRPDVAIIGYRLAEKMRIPLGGSITLVAPEGNATALGTLPRFKRFHVVGLFEMGMHEYDSTFVFIPLESAQRFFKTYPGVSGLEIFVEDPNQVHVQAGAIQSLVDLTENRVFDWQHANATFFETVQVERNVMFLILTLIILIAAFNVISSLIMLVKDKTRDIAILRTMGATTGMVQRVFFMIGASVGVAGTGFGAFLGLAFAWNIESIRRFLESLTGTQLFRAEIYFLSRLPAKVDPHEVLVVTGMALTLTLLATLYPSWRAARIHPTEALRYE